MSIQKVGLDIQFLNIGLMKNLEMGTKGQAQGALKVIANRNRYHPVREYLVLVSETVESIDLDLVAVKALA